ncbi:MAG: phenylalanine--tRNA ligase subunit beta [Clostridia bacterium]|nr:phenylalanine--tRNA ligase subunit beta [Clostridia bacterium]
MKVLLSWINDFVDIEGIEVKEIGKLLTDSGFEIEEIIDKAKGLENVIAAKIVQIKKHPNADKLVICQTDIGNGKGLQVVTGATNMKEGDLVPLALDGANLPCGVSIKNNVIRGAESNGMFCGGDELGIDNTIYKGAETYGLLILKNDVIPGTPMAEVLGLNEIVLDVNVLPNRPDCNSILGIAREISALTKRPLKEVDVSYTTEKLDKKVYIKVENFDLCNRYIGTIVENIKNGESPTWMQKRLKLLDHTPHNLLVDITNYVLLEIGQPMHAFDMDKIDGKQLFIRAAKSGENIKALDGKVYKLESSNLVIADTDKPLVIAGIIGGKESGTYPETKDVLLESAVFNYANIRRTSHAIGLSSDSSVRFSKGVYFNSAELGMKRALNLISMLKAGKINEISYDVYENSPETIIVKSEVSRINERLALDVSAKEMVSILNRLGIETTEKNGILTSYIPDYRTDIERECDICEEVGRIYGLNNIKTDNTTTAFQPIGEKLLSQKNIDTIKVATAAEGFNEMISYQFISPKIIENLNQNPNEFIKLANPIGLEYSIMRKSLVPAALSAISYNQKIGNKDLYLFELARVFLPKALPLIELPNETNFLCLSVCSEGEDFYTLKNSLDKILQAMNITLEYRSSKNEFLHPGVTADIYLHNKKIGIIGKVHPVVLERFEIVKDVYIAEIDLSYILTKNPEYRFVVAPPKFPNIERDIALIVNKDVTASSLLGIIKKNFKNEIENAYIFDIYEGNQIGEGFKSVAIKLQIKQPEKTLNEEEISKIVTRVIVMQEKENGAKLR